MSIWRRQASGQLGGWGLNLTGWVSACTPQTVLKTIFDHTSALSTVVNCFGLPQGKLGKRQAKAPDVSEALALTAARQDRPPFRYRQLRRSEWLGALPP
jgi:hypothetical protein